MALFHLISSYHTLRNLKDPIDSPRSTTDLNSKCLGASGDVTGPHLKFMTPPTLRSESRGYRPLLWTSKTLSCAPQRVLGPLKFNIDTEKIAMCERRYIFQTIIFGIYVRCRGCRYWSVFAKKNTHPFCKVIDLINLNCFTHLWENRFFKILSQSSRFVPYTFSETIRHRWYLWI